jgi:hypothetical protein
MEGVAVFPNKSPTVRTSVTVPLVGTNGNPPIVLAYLKTVAFGTVLYHLPFHDFILLNSAGVMVPDLEKYTYSMSVTSSQITFTQPIDINPGIASTETAVNYIVLAEQGN